MRQDDKHKNLQQLTLTIISFMLAILILDVKGLVAWADGLESGAIKDIAKPVTKRLDDIISPLQIAKIRQPLVALLHDKPSYETPSLPENPSIQTSITTQPSQNHTAKPKEKVVKKTAETMPRAITTDYANIPIPKHTPLDKSLAKLNQQKPITIALAGDSMMAVGLYSSIQNHFAKDKNLRFIKANKAATGLTRPEVFNWIENYPKMVGKHKVDLVIVAIGANDAQDVSVNGKLLKYGSTSWFDMYEKRLDDYLSMLGQGGAKVIWVSLPVMRSDKFNQKMQLMNQFTYQVSKRYPNVSWFNANQFLANTHGKYQEFGKTQVGKNIRLRGNDGIHLTDEGAQLLVPSLFSWYNP